MNTTPGGESLALDQLLLPLYRSGSEADPWRAFLEALCRALDAEAATLALRPSAAGRPGLCFTAAPDSREPPPAEPFPDDPFIGLEAGTVCAIADRVDPHRLPGTGFHQRFAVEAGLRDMLALNLDAGQGHQARLRLLRRQPRPFGLGEKSLLLRLYPHLCAALEAFEARRRLQLENAACIGAIDQLAFGVIILNERGQVTRVNETASVIMKESRLLRVVGPYLNTVDPDHELAVAGSVRALLEPGPERPWRALRLASRQGDRHLYLLFKAIAGSDAAPPGLALFLSYDSLQRRISIDTFAGLYQLTRAEVALVAELLDGVSIIEASAALGISEHTARAQLRSVFAKTGTHRQADLVRLAFSSLAIIA